jgi:hypothetical protein
MRVGVIRSSQKFSGGGGGGTRADMGVITPVILRSGFLLELLVFRFAVALHVHRVFFVI